MKKIWIVLGIIAVLLFIGYLYDRGYINVSWEWASIILAALAGPFTFLQKKLSFGKKKSSSKVAQMLQEQEQLKQELETLRRKYDIDIKKRELKIQQLQAELERLQERLEQLELEKAEIQHDVQNMTIEQKRNEIINYFGD